MEKKVLCEVVKYLKLDKVKIDSDKDTVAVEAKGKRTSGFVCGTLALVRTFGPHLEGTTHLERTLTHSWLTYFSTRLFHCASLERENLAKGNKKHLTERPTEMPVPKQV
ncbi:hypothetical protein E2C01_033438 [Portunus trituberculatus]|uniref:Uncharacterized protein n=1 Tax=Portunus trituberculatus TaxID=210409 RepID=A0A5B7F3F4_PORTR|nr:hypothetical protein [Portunus trituberculatus]